MVRTVISLPEADKHWLDREAARQHTSMTEVVRQAVEALRRAKAGQSDPFDDLLDRTSGIWGGGDGMAWQTSLRAEWVGESRAP